MGQHGELMLRQFPLRLSRERQRTFTNYIVGTNPKAVRAVEALCDSSEADSLYLWGKSCGKTHLLLAALDAVERHGAEAVYLPMREMAGLSPACLDGLIAADLVCIDDIEQIAGNPAWEEALFHLYNRTRDHNGRLLLTGHASLSRLGIQLPDLQSRLSWGANYRLRALNDEGLRELLLQLSVDRGMEMSGDAVDYLLKRYSRDIKALVVLIDDLDKRSLSAKQKLTIPFLRQSLSEINSETGSLP
jgi:DnaA family protein